MRVRLFIEDGKSGLKATIREQDDTGGYGNSKSFTVATIDEAKRRAARLARDLGLPSYNLVDRRKQA